jgi:Putative copper export protein
VYRVKWHVVATDGHPSSGSFAFTVAGADRSAGAHSTCSAPSNAPVREDFPRAAALFRGIGVSALLALAGLLFFSMGHGGSRAGEYRSAVNVLAIVAFIALFVQLVLWNRYVAPDATFGAAVWEAMLSSLPGRLELLRMVVVTVAAFLFLWGAAGPLPLGVTGIAIIITGAIGHPVATTAAVSIPMVVVHLAAVSIWLGGILSLVILRRVDAASYLVHAGNVSKLALIAAILVTVTGTVESALLLTAPSDLLFTGYGQIILVKCAGLALLVAWGGYHRFRSIPRLAAGLQRDMVLSLRYEIAVMTAVIVVAAFLSYAPLPR